LFDLSDLFVGIIFGIVDGVATEASDFLVDLEHLKLVFRTQYSTSYLVLHVLLGLIGSLFHVFRLLLDGLVSAGE
jgi:hypothetical protein